MPIKYKNLTLNITYIDEGIDFHDLMAKVEQWYKDNSKKGKFIDMGWKFIKEY